MRSLKSRISRLEKRSGGKLPYKRAVSVVSHEHYPKEKLTAFLQENGVDPDDPELFIINHRIVEPDRGSKNMFEPRLLNKPRASTGTEHRPRNTS